jgi:hypothetical protein
MVFLIDAQVRRVAADTSRVFAPLMVGAPENTSKTEVCPVVVWITSRAESDVTLRADCDTGVRTG